MSTTAVWTVSLPGTLTVLGTQSPKSAASCPPPSRECQLPSLWSSSFQVLLTHSLQDSPGLWGAPSGMELHQAVHSGLLFPSSLFYLVSQTHLLPACTSLSCSRLLPLLAVSRDNFCFPCLLRKSWKQDMERGNPEWACASGPMGRSGRPRSRPQISECGTRGGTKAREDFWEGMGVSASVSSPAPAWLET